MLAWEVLANLCHAPSVHELAFGHGLVDVLHSSLSGSQEVGALEEGAVEGAKLGSGGRGEVDVLVSLFRCVLALAVPEDSRGRCVACRASMMYVVGVLGG